MQPADDWCTIESDPAVFTELLERVGCRSVELQEVYTLDDEALPPVVYGLIFLFQWFPNTSNNNSTSTPDNAATHPHKDCLDEDQIPEHLFFAHQVTTNACATQALLSVVLNTVPELGETLSEFKTFTSSFPPQLKGVAVSSSEALKVAHNAFARPDAFWNDPNQPKPPNHDKEGEAFHFVAYIPSPDQTVVYELDGLQKGPIVVGTIPQPEDHDNNNNNKPNITNNRWTNVAKTALQQRMADHQHVKYNLMAVIPSQLQALEEQLERDPHNSTVATQLATERQKRAHWKLENERRRHNYVPLCIQLLKELARTEQLPSLVEAANEKQQQRRIAYQAKKQG